MHLPTFSSERVARILLALTLAGCAGRASGTEQSVGGERSTSSEAVAITVSGEGTSTSNTTTHTPSSEPDRAAHRAACDAGEACRCHAAALDAYYRPSTSDSDADALEYFTRGCDLGCAPSCSGLGTLYAQGRGVPQDDERAAMHFRGACERGASTACQLLAGALREGRGVPRDEAGAIRADARHACASDAALGRVSLEACPSL